MDTCYWAGLFLHSVESLSLERAGFVANSRHYRIRSAPAPETYLAAVEAVLAVSTSRQAWMASLLLSTASLSVVNSGAAAASATATNGGDVTLTISRQRSHRTRINGIVIGNRRTVVAIRRVVNYNNNI
jgi:hypothetical protein